MKPTLVLLPSPLLGPAVWAPVAGELARSGWPVIRPPAPEVAPRSPDDVLRTVLAALPPDRELVLIPHSNAGLYVPAITAERRIAGYVFVDAGLPPSAGQVPLAPTGFFELLESKADGQGLLPAWTQWWDDDAGVTTLFPDARTRELVEREQGRLPLSYFARSIVVPAGWADRPGAYLAFGDTYAEERRAAADRGWPVATLTGGHLQMLVSPEPVAAEIRALLTAIGLR